MNKITTAIVGFGIITILILSQTQSRQEQSIIQPTPPTEINTSDENVQNGDVEADSDVQTYSFTEISQNGSVDSCWVAISGNVYDLTDWVQEHPGGPARILSICGTDATETFAGMHGENENAKAALDMFLIGTLSS